MYVRITDGLWVWHPWATEIAILNRLKECLRYFNGFPARKLHKVYQADRLPDRRNIDDACSVRVRSDAADVSYLAWMLI